MPVRSSVRTFSPNGHLALLTYSNPFSGLNHHRVARLQHEQVERLHKAVPIRSESTLSIVFRLNTINKIYTVPSSLESSTFEPMSEQPRPLAQHGSDSPENGPPGQPRPSSQRRSKSPDNGPPGHNSDSFTDQPGEAVRKRRFHEHRDKADNPKRSKRKSK